jgi:hypothetical protein
MKYVNLLSTYFLLLLLLSSCSSLPNPPVSTANSGDILYQEQFENNRTGWARFSNENGIMDYDGGGYRILVQQPQLNIWSTPEKDFADVRLEADVIKLNGPDENRMGLICRYRGGDYYFFIISNDGYYVIGKFIGGLTLLLGQSEMQASGAIQTGTMNHLRADCIGDKLTFYINFSEVSSATDADFSTGDVGVLAGAFSEPGVDVLFDNFVVIQP